MPSDDKPYKCPFNNKLCPVKPENEEKADWKCPLARMSHQCAIKQISGPECYGLRDKIFMIVPFGQNLPLL